MALLHAPCPHTLKFRDNIKPNTLGDLWAEVTGARSLREAGAGSSIEKPQHSRRTQGTRRDCLRAQAALRTPTPPVSCGEQQDVFADGPENQQTWWTSAWVMGA